MTPAAAASAAAAAPTAVRYSGHLRRAEAVERPRLRVVRPRHICGAVLTRPQRVRERHHHHRARGAPAEASNS